jgi:1-deoxy-D-xylulose-5-phosphate reductoisomerase
LARHPDAFRVVALAAYRNGAQLAELAKRFSDAFTVLVDERSIVTCGTLNGRIRTGRTALLEAATHPSADIVLNAVVGAAGLEATLAALGAGKRLALANKESLVAGGPLVLAARSRGRGELIPVDSEHSAIFQCLCGAPDRTLRRIILTASGGPFRGWTVERMSAITREDALRHPTWAMGEKITVDSATLVNKALEVIEAHFLFGVPYDAIEVVVHPQSIVHSMVEFVDGSVLAQMGFPTMELPILYALTHPRRLADTGVPGFDPVQARELTFEAVAHERFPAFQLGVQAGRAGGTAPAVFNAANEVAVAGFLEGRLAFSAIAEVIDAVLEDQQALPIDSLETVLEADRQARCSAMEIVKSRC